MGVVLQCAWFDRPEVVEASRRGDFGAVLFAARNAAGMSQQQVADLLGCSRATVSRYETGAFRLGDVDLLRHVARRMRIPGRLFGLAEPGPPPGMLGLDTAGEVLVMQRRNVLAGLAASAAVVPALQLGAAGMLRGLDAALFGMAPPTVAPVGGQALARGLASARGLFTRCRWKELAQALPPLIEGAAAARSHAAFDGTAAAEAMLAKVYVLANELAIKLHVNPTAMVLADRAVQAARASGDPRVLAQAQWRLAISLRRSRHAASAAPLVAAAAADLKTATDLATPWDGGFYARMLCCGAYTLALDGRRSAAYELIDHARAVVAEFPRALFTPDDIDLYAISVSRAVGEFGHATAFAKRITVGVLPDVERRARYFEDAAIAWWGAGDPARTFAALRAAEALSPQEVRYRPWAHRLTVNLLSHPQRAGLSGLREFAGRIGVGSAGL